MKLTDAQLRDAVRNTHKASCKACRKEVPGWQAGREYLEAFAKLHSKPAHDIPLASERQKES